MNIYDITDICKIFNGGNFKLPITWDGRDFILSLQNVFKDYRDKVCDNSVGIICDEILDAVRVYLDGFPARAYDIFSCTMDKLIDNPLKILNKTGEIGADSDPLKLFRVVYVPERYNYGRDRVFHTPYDMRSKIGTNRYSIAGYPCLYLATTLDLCLRELGSRNKQQLAARFQVMRTRYDIKVELLELGIKPNDFQPDGINNERVYANGNDYDRNLNYFKTRKIQPYLLQDANFTTAYVLWYPLIAACSFIRKFKQEPFAPEYIVPQLLMQWLRNYNSNSTCNANSSVLGIRYFSCASAQASELGFNYVFPTAGEPDRKYNRYCEILSRIFKLTKPVYIEDYPSVDVCEQNLINDADIDFI